MKGRSDRSEFERAKRSFSCPTRIYDLSIEAQYDLLRLLADSNPPRVVSDELRRSHGALISPKAISDWARHHRQEIADRRTLNLGELDDVPLRYRKVRVLKLSKLARRLEKSGHLRGAASLLRQIREEVGDSSHEDALQNLPNGVRIKVNPVREWSEADIVTLLNRLPEGQEKTKIIEGMDLLLEVARRQENDPDGRDDHAAGEIRLKSLLPHQGE